MIDDENYLQSSRNFRLSAEVLALMFKGAGYAALFCFGIALVALFLLVIGAALPEASKEAADPTPDFSMVAPAIDPLA